MDLSSKRDLNRLRDVLNSLNFEDLNFQTRGISYSSDGDSCTVKLVVSKPGAESKEAKDFRAGAELYGLKPEHLGAEVTVNGKRLKIDGVSVRSRKYPILATEVESGKRFKYTSDGIARALKAEGIA